MRSCNNGMCGGCPDCLVAQGYMLPQQAIIDRELDLIGKYDLADLILEVYGY